MSGFEIVWGYEIKPGKEAVRGRIAPPDEDPTSRQRAAQMAATQVYELICADLGVDPMIQAFVTLTDDQLRTLYEKQMVSQDGPRH